MERPFEEVRAAMPKDIEISVFVNKYISKGAWPRLIDAIRAATRQRSINHVLGDVHYLTWLLPRRRTLLTIHDCATLERLRGPRLWLFWFLWFWLPLKKAAVVTVVSSYTKENLMKWVSLPATQIHVIPPPLSPLFVHIPRETGDTSRPRILHIGTAKNKNLLRLIEALDGLDVLLVVVGALEEQHFQVAKEHGVEIENHIGLTTEQLVEQYAKARLLAFVSTYEGFGMPIIEAQAVGRPVVTSNACSMPEAAGGAALLVDPLSVADIRRGIVQVLQDEHLAAKLVELGRENARQYAPETIAMGYAELYRKLHAQASGHSATPIDIPDNLV